MPVGNATKMTIFQTDATKAALIRILRDIRFEKKNIQVGSIWAERMHQRNPKNIQKSTTINNQQQQHISITQSTICPPNLAEGNPMLSPMGARRRRQLLPPLERERERDASEEERRGAEWIKTPPHLPLSVLSPSKKKKKKSPFLGSARLIGCRFF